MGKDRGQSETEVGSVAHVASLYEGVGGHMVLMKAVLVPVLLYTAGDKG